ncbi:PH domain-containing protein [Phytomonospora sp. NPDC050363]|uniref:PH domain-containing protein n=1 Tax=Phytomonospora sp. NPDC050363 TaxID=3155642 RepID=UPI0033D8F2FD
MEHPIWNGMDGEVDWRPVDPRLVWVRLINLALGAIPATALAVVLSAWWWGARFALLAGVLAAVLIVSRVIAIVRAVRVWAYAEADEHLLIRHGIWTRRLSIVPYGRLQYLDLTADPASRVFGLTTVKLHTAAATTDATVPGLAPDEATALRDRLADVSGARTEGL